MGTVQKIVEALLKLSEDKKTQLSKRHDEHSSWMNNELALIRDLIKHSGPSNGRGHASLASNQSGNGTTEAGRPSGESMESSSSAGSKKRKKTPDVCDTGLSPDLKVRHDTRRANVDLFHHTHFSPRRQRSSGDGAEGLAAAAAAAGLPTDLNKLTRKQLLEELEVRLEGRSTVSSPLKPPSPPYPMWAS